MKLQNTILTITALFGSAVLAVADHHLPGEGGSVPGGAGGDGAEGGDKTLGDGGLPEFLAKYDLDSDGILNEEERQAARDDRRERHNDHRESWDSNGNGVLSPEEREAARDALRARIEERRSARFVEADGGEGGDGELTIEEFSAIGAVTRLAERHPEIVLRIFNRLDTSDNGTISKEEFIAHLRHRRPHGHDEGDGEGGEGEGGEEPPAGE